MTIRYTFRATKTWTSFYSAIKIFLFLQDFLHHDCSKRAPAHPTTSTLFWTGCENDTASCTSSLSANHFPTRFVYAWPLSDALYFSPLQTTNTENTFCFLRQSFIKNLVVTLPDPDRYTFNKTRRRRSFSRLRWNYRFIMFYLPHTL